MELILSMDINNKVINSFLCLCASAALGAGGMYLYNKKHNDTSTGSDNKLISECETILRDNDVKLPSDSELESAAIKGYLSALGDKFTKYTSPEDSEAEYVENINNYPTLITCGYKVGRNSSGELEVVDVEDGSIADKQGLAKGDIILAVDQKTVADDGVKMTAFELVGKDGTVMQLRLKRDDSEISLDFTRSVDDSIDKDDVSAELIGDVLKLNIRTITNFTKADINGTIQNFSGKYNKMIVDLRDNIGGDVESSVSVSDMFVDSGQVKCYFNNGEELLLEAGKDPDDINVRTVVLVNGMTASSAEIITAMFKQFHGDVTIVGENTYGKGIFQKDATLSNGGTLTYTAGYYTVGDWECYQDKGIAPDVEVKMDKELKNTDKDTQLKKALDILG